MKFDQIAGRAIAMVGAGMILLRRFGAEPAAPAMGAAPAIPQAKPQGIPTLKMPTAHGWKDGNLPSTAPGLQVNAFATGLRHPRSLLVLPNGDVLTAEARFLPGGISSPFDYAMFVTMKRAAAAGDSPNRISILRDADGDGVAEVVQVFRDGLSQPFGTALLGDTLYIGNVDELLAFDYIPGSLKLTGPGKSLARFKSGGHWTRSLLLSPDGTKLYIGVGSDTNIADNGMAVEAGRACISEYDIATGILRP